MRTKTVIGGVFFVLASAVALAGVLLYSPLAPAAPSVKWTPSAIVQEVAVGESVTISASYTASKNLGDVVARVVPELAPYVAVDPLAYGNVSKGGTYDLTLTISVPVDAVIGTYDGTIQLRSGSGSTTYAKPLPVELSVRWQRINDVVPGVSIVTPPQWVISQERDDLISISNVVEPSPISKEALQTEAHFVIRTLRGVNPSLLPISAWFDEFFSGGFAVEPWSKEVVQVDGKEAVRIGASEIVGPRYHYYVTHGTDIINVVYGLYADQFLDEYDVMINSIVIDE